MILEFLCLFLVNEVICQEISFAMQISGLYNFSNLKIKLSSPQVTSMIDFGLLEINFSI